MEGKIKETICLKATGYTKYFELDFCGKLKLFLIFVVCDIILCSKLDKLNAIFKFK